MNELAKRTQFQPGQSGNPNGKPPGACGDPRFHQDAPGVPLNFIGWTFGARLGVPPFSESASSKIVARDVEGLLIAPTKLGGMWQFKIRNLMAPRACVIEPGYVAPEEHGYWEGPHYQSYSVGGRMFLVPVIGDKRG